MYVRRVECYPSVEFVSKEKIPQLLLLAIADQVRQGHTFVATELPPGEWVDITPTPSHLSSLSQRKQKREKERLGKKEVMSYPDRRGGVSRQSIQSIVGLGAKTIGV